MADCKLTEADKDRVKTKLPSWFKPEMGFKFTWDHCPAIVVGWGGWRSFDTAGETSVVINHEKYGFSLGTHVFKPATLVCAFLYKGEWHLFSLEDDDNILDILPWIP